MPRLLPVVLLLAAVVTTTGGCDSTNLSDDEVGDLVLSVTAEGFFLETEETYPCANYPLVVDANVNSRRANIEVEGVGEIDACLTALGPARTVVSFAEGTEPVGYEIVVEKDGQTDRFDYTCGVAGCFLTPIGEPSFTRVGSR